MSAVAYDGMEGVKKAKDWQPDIVLCDIGLPLLDGFCVAKELRNNLATAVTLVIAISGFALQSTAGKLPRQISIITCSSRLISRSWRVCFPEPGAPATLILLHVHRMPRQMPAVEALAVSRPHASVSIYAA